jgi:hypothetical protein
MNWISRPTTAVSTVVGSSHSTRIFRCTHWPLFGGPSHPAGLRQGSRTWLSARRCVRPSRWNDPYHRSCVTLPDAGSRNRAVSLLRLAVNSARPSLVAGVMFGRVRAAVIIDQNPSAGPNDER